MKKEQSPKMKELSQIRIKELIDEFANGSQQEFADACDVAKASISQYVNKTNSPGNITAAKIASRYGLNPLWVMGFDVPKVIKSENYRQNIVITETERNLLKKYRLLDEFGKDMAETVVEKEYQRCITYKNLDIAAHVDGGDFSEEQDIYVSKFSDITKE